VFNLSGPTPSRSVEFRFISIGRNRDENTTLAAKKKESLPGGEKKALSPENRRFSRMCEKRISNKLTSAIHS